MPWLRAGEPISRKFFLSEYDYLWTLRPKDLISMKRFFSVKDYLQTPKTNTHLFTANTVRRVHPFFRSNQSAKTIRTGILKEVLIASFNGESGTKSPRAVVNREAATNRCRGSSPEIRVRMIQLLPSFYLSLRLHLKLSQKRLEKWLLTSLQTSALELVNQAF